MKKQTNTIYIAIIGLFFCTISYAQTAVYDSFTLCPSSSLFGFYPLNNDYVSGGSIDPTSIDLDVDTPGIQPSRTLDGVTYTTTPTGEIVLSNYGIGAISFEYTFTDTLGAISNTVYMAFLFQPTILVNLDDFSSTPIDGTIGGTTTNILSNDSMTGGGSVSTAVALLIGETYGFTIVAGGEISVPAGTTSGTYILTYLAFFPACPTDGHEATITIVVVDSLSNNQHFQTTSTLVYPNPIDNIVNIESDSTIKLIEIIDLNGRIINTFNSSSNTTVNLEQLTGGIYFIKVSSEKGVNMQKVIKK